MFNKNLIELKLDAEILELLELMNKDDDKTTLEYAARADMLAKLYELRQKSRISKEQLATIGANLAGIAVILMHERVHVIASKAFSLVKKIV